MMANEITGASLSPIYNRLNSVPEYHPLEADTFSDWSMEAGDVVTVTRDGKEYKSPVHSSKLTWKGGAPTVTVNASGNEEREAISKASRKKYGRGSSGLRNSERSFQEIITSYNNMTAGLILASSSAALFVEDKYSQMKSGLDLTSSSASLYVENKYSQMKSGLDLTSSSASLYVNNKYSQMSSGLNLTSSSAALYVNNKYSQMSSGLNLTSSSAALYVNNKYSQMSSGLNLTSSSAALYVNNKYSQMSSGLNLTSSSAALYVNNKYSQMSSGLNLTSSSAALYVNNKYSQMSSGLNLTSSSAALYVNNKYSQMSSGLNLTSSSAALYVDNKYSQMSSGLNLTSSSAALYVDNKYSQMSSGLNLTSSSAALYVDNKYSQMSSGLNLTSSSAALYVDNKYSQMSSGLNLTSSSAALYVNSKYDQMTAGLKLTSSTAALYVNGKTSKAQLLLSINGAGHSDAYLEADNITLDGSTKMTDTLTIENGGLKVSKAATFLQDVTLTGTGATVHSTNYQLYSGGKVKFNASTQGGSEVAVGYNEFDTMIIKAAVSGNVLKLWKRGENTGSDPALTFSKATSVSGAWSGEGNEQKWVVTATQNGEIVGGRSIGFGGGPTVRLRLGTNGTPTAVTGNRSRVSAPVHVYTNDSEGGSTVTNDRYTTNLTIDGSIPYRNGKDDGKDELKDEIHRVGVALPAVEDTGYYTCTIYDASSGTIKTLNASYDSGTPANSTGVRVPLLANQSLTTNGSHAPNTANYLGYKSVNVNVGASLNSCGFVNSTQNLPSGTKENVTTDVRSVITGNWSTPGYIYWRFNVGGTYYVFYTSTKGN